MPSRRARASMLATALSLALALLLAGAPAAAPEDPGSAPSASTQAKPRPTTSPKSRSRGRTKPGARTAPEPTSPAPAGTARDARARAAELLRPPSHSDEEIDWSAIPPWRQTRFFGLRAQGKLFVYVVDCSGSMADAGRLLRAKAELRRSIMTLQFPQRFLVVFYNDRPLPMNGGDDCSADYSNKSRFLRWLDVVHAGGETDPRGALTYALAVAPDAVFLLSDGEYPEGTVAAIARLNARRVPIHCIDLSGGAAGDDLRQIAEQSGGQYAARP